jgi:hypothetical protein
MLLSLLKAATQQKPGNHKAWRQSASECPQAENPQAKLKISGGLQKSRQNL